MRLSQWRDLFQRFVSDRVFIDSWLLERPQFYSQLVGFMPPLRNMDYSREDNILMVLTATQDFIISQRLPSELSFKDLPLDTLEGQYNTLAIAFMANYQSIHTDIRDMRFNMTEEPIAVAEVAEDANDWIVDFKWSLRVEIEVEPEVGGIVEPFDLRYLQANVYRDQLNDDTSSGSSDPTKRHLDFRILWDKTQ